MNAQIAKNGSGDYALGFTVDGAFVPLATVAAHRVGHLVERQATLKARADDPSHEGNKQALEAIADDWKVADTAAAAPTPSTPSSPTSGTPGEPATPAEPTPATPPTSTGQEL